MSLFAVTINHRTLILGIFCILISAIPRSHVVQATSINGVWDTQFPLQGLSGNVNAFAIGETGDVYVAGLFTQADGKTVNNIARWDGQNWHPVGKGVGGRVFALTLDGNGNLYAGGTFVSVEDATGEKMAFRVAKWDGNTWSPLGTGMNSAVFALDIDSNGILYAGGTFTTAGGGAANKLAKWDGNMWSTVSNDSPDGPVHALVVDDQDNLYVGGDFTQIGATLVNHIGLWNGSQWQPLQFGAGLGLNAAVNALAFDHAGNLYAGGDFIRTGSVELNFIAGWNGSNWYALATSNGIGMNGAVLALAVDSQNQVYAGGDFTVAGGEAVNHVAKWGSGAWSALPNNGEVGLSNSAFALAVDGNDTLYVGGRFSSAGDLPLNRIARWDGTWSPLTAGGKGVNNAINVIVPQADNTLYVGGAFNSADGLEVHKLARWNGNQWEALDSNKPDSEITALAVDQNGIIYAGGSFLSIEQLSVNRIARRDANGWSALIANNSIGVSDKVMALAIDGNNHLYVGGSFIQAGNTTVNYIAKWDGTNWSTLGTGLEFRVRALVFDQNGHLYAGGDFLTAGGVVVNHIAKWDGNSWSALGSGVDNRVYALAVDNAGNLYAGGTFATAGGQPASNIAKWDGNSWSALGSGVDGRVTSLTMRQDGTLYAGGDFINAGSVIANRVAHWDGNVWSALGSGIDDTVHALAVDGNNDLFAGGLFTTAGETASYRFARWQTNSTPPPTATPSATHTAIPTATDTTIPTATSTQPSTATPTETATPLPTVTAVPSNTATSIPTATAIPSNTATPLPTATATAVLSNTATSTPTSTATVAPTSTPSIMPTDTATPVPSATPTASATAMPTETETPTSLPSATPKASATSMTPEPETPTPEPTIIPTDKPTSTATPPAIGNNVFYVSFSRSGTIQGVPFRDEDVVMYDEVTNTWSRYFDGSDLGLQPLDIKGLHIMDNGDILMSFNQDLDHLDGIGPIDDSDIYRFTPTLLGIVTEGTLTHHFDGSDVGLSRDYDESINTISLLGDGRLLISTPGYVGTNTPGVSGSDTDLFVFNATSLGSQTQGTWEKYFDGSDVGLEDNSDDIWGTWVDGQTGEIYLTTRSDFDLGNGFVGNQHDIFICNPISLGLNTDCDFSYFWNIGTKTGDSDLRIDAFAIGQPSSLFVRASAEDIAAEANDPEEDDDSQGDDLYGELGIPIYLPIIVRQ